MGPDFNLYLSVRVSDRLNEGKMIVTTFESGAIEMKVSETKLTFYTPEGQSLQHDWVKDLLVQVIEQL